MIPKFKYIQDKTWSKNKTSLEFISVLTCFARRVGGALVLEDLVEFRVEHAVGVDDTEEDAVAEEGTDHDQPGPGAAVGRRAVLLEVDVLFRGGAVQGILGADQVRLLVEEVCSGVFHHFQ